MTKHTLADQIANSILGDSGSTSTAIPGRIKQILTGGTGAVAPERPTGYFSVLDGHELSSAELGVTNTVFGNDGLVYTRNNEGKLGLAPQWLQDQFRGQTEAGGGGGGSAAASAAASLAESKRQFDISQKYQTEIDKARMAADREASLRSEMNDLRQARISERMAAREQGTQLAGTDPFRTLGSLRARAIQGSTPLDVFKGELGQAASFQEPVLGPGASIADLESAIAKMSQPLTPQGGGLASAFRPPGLERGGTVSKEEVQPFTMGRPHPKTAIEFAKKAGMTTVMTGERSGGPELVIGKEFTVIPLSDEEEDELMHGPFDIPKAQTGVTVGGTAAQQLGGTGVGPNYGLEGFQDLLRGLRERSGFQWRQGLPSRGEAASLGAFQKAPGSLLKSSVSDKVYMVDETGRLRWVTNPDVFNQSGFNWGNIETLANPDEIGLFERGADITGPFSLPAGGLGAVGAIGSPLSIRRGIGEIPGMSPGEADRLANLIGFLPAPHRVGGLFNRLLPAEQTALISAYRMAGIPEADLLNIIGRTGIRGRARTGTFTG